MAQSNNFRGVWVVLLALVSALVTAPASARSLSDLDAVHQSAFQRALVMRVAKAHIQLASAADPVAARQALDASIRQYDRNLDQLEANSPNSIINRRVVKMKRLWQEFKSVAKHNPDRNSMILVLEGSDNLLFQADALVREWQTRLPQQRGERNEWALQQSMLSERIGLFHAAQAYGLGEPWILEELKYSMRAYELGLKQLRAGSFAGTDSVAIAQLDSQWHAAKPGLLLTGTGSALPVAMESMYAQANQLGELYRDQDRLAMTERRMAVGLAANVSVE